MGGPKCEMSLIGRDSAMKLAIYRVGAVGLPGAGGLGGRARQRRRGTWCKSFRQPRACYFFLVADSWVLGNSRERAGPSVPDIYQGGFSQTRTVYCHAVRPPTSTGASGDLQAGGQAQAELNPIPNEWTRIQNLIDSLISIHHTINPSRARPGSFRLATLATTEPRDAPIAASNLAYSYRVPPAEATNSPQ